MPQLETGCIDSGSCGELERLNSLTEFILMLYNRGALW